MIRRRMTVGVLALLLAVIAAQPSGTNVAFDFDMAEARSEVARANAAVKVGIGGATVLVTWTQNVLR